MTDSDPARGLPERIAPVFRELWQDVTLVDAIWHELRTLFDGTERRIELLSATAWWFFAMTRRSMQFSVVVLLSRLFDPAGQGDRANICLRALVDAVEAEGEHELAAQLARELDCLAKHAEDLRDYRHKIVAHRDRKVATGAAELRRKMLDADYIESVLTRVCDLMNRVTHHFANRTTAWVPVSGMGSNALVGLLEQALRLEDEERARHGLPMLYAGRCYDPDPEGS